MTPAALSSLPQAVSSYLVIAAVAALVTVLTVPIFRVIASSRGLMVEPDERRAHQAPTPAIGGGAMYLGFVVAFGVAWATGWFSDSFDASTEPLAVVLAATVAYLVGLIDDIRELSAPAKIAGLVLVGGLLFGGGISIIWFRIPFVELLLLSLDLSFLVTVLWVVGMANAVNVIDGLDGLAAGIMAIGSGAFFLYAMQLRQVDLLLAGNIGPLVAVVVLGICVGFLPWNVHPARIFMGDGGALLLGSLMAASTMAVGGRTPDPFSGQTFFFYAPIVIPFVILGVPILDTAFAIIRRATRRQGLATADRDHLHHRLIRMGHGHRRAVAILWAWTALLSALVLWPVYNAGSGDAVVPIGVFGLAVLLYVSLRPGQGGVDDLLNDQTPSDQTPSDQMPADSIPEGPVAPVADEEAGSSDSVVVPLNARARGGRTPLSPGPSEAEEAQRRVARGRRQE